MKEMFKRIVETSQPLVDLVLSLPADYSRDQSLTRLQEAVWWANKVVQESLLKEKLEKEEPK